MSLQNWNLQNTFMVLTLNSNIMKNLFLITLLLSFTSNLFAQITELPEVVITAVNYKYLNSLDTEDTAESVKMLHEKVALYDLKGSDLYEDTYDTYYMTFFIPEGKIAAAYDVNGKVVRTIEKFKDIKLPISVRDAVAKRFPNWAIEKNIYRVNYHNTKGIGKQQYQITLSNGDKTMRVKTDVEGNFINGNNSM